MSIQAFVDNGYSQGSEYCRQFLSSPEFKQKTLLSILGYGSSGFCVETRSILIVYLTKYS